jgi:hypothetical protein
MSATAFQLRRAEWQLEASARAADTCAENALHEHDPPDHARAGRHREQADAMRAAVAVLRAAREAIAVAQEDAA